MAVTVATHITDIAAATVARRFVCVRLNSFRPHYASFRSHFHCHSKTGKKFRRKRRRRGVPELISGRIELISRALFGAYVALAFLVLLTYRVASMGLMGCNGQKSLLSAFD